MYKLWKIVHFLLLLAKQINSSNNFTCDMLI